MFLHPVKYPVHKHFHPRHFGGYLFSRDRVICLPDLSHIFISCLDNFLYFRREFRKLLLLSGRFRLALSFLSFRPFHQGSVLTVSLIAGHQAGPLLVQMALTEPSFPDHFLQILYNRFYRFSRLLGKFFDLAVFPFFDHLDILPEPPYRARHVCTGNSHDKKSNTEQPEDCHSDFQHEIKSGRCCAQSQEQQKYN